MYPVLALQTLLDSVINEVLLRTLPIEQMLIIPASFQESASPPLCTKDRQDGEGITVGVSDKSLIELRDNYACVPINRATRLTRSSVLKGLARKSLAPLAKAFSPLSGLALKTMTGRSEKDRNISKTSNPSIQGMTISSSMTSGLVERTRLRASSPSDVVMTS